MGIARQALADVMEEQRKVKQLRLFEFLQQLGEIALPLVGRLFAGAIQQMMLVAWAEGLAVASIALARLSLREPETRPGNPQTQSLRLSPE